MFAFGARVAAMLVLFYVSLFNLPLLEGYQLDGGFWAFAPDAKAYHEATGETIGQLRLGLPPPQAYGVGEGPYFYFLIALYWVLGVHPLNGLLVNCWAGAATVPFAYVLGLRLGGRRAGRLSAVLIGMWPSAAFWSTQLLKDPLVVHLLFALCVTVVNVLHERGGEVSRHPLSRIALGAAGAMALMVSLRLFNLYVPMGVIGAATLTMLPIAALRLRTKEGRGRGGVLVGMWLMLVVALPVSRAVTFRDMIVRPHVETEFLAFGDGHLTGGQFDEAIGEYEKALLVSPLFQPAWFNRAIAHRLTGETETQVQIETLSGFGRGDAPRVDPVVLRGEDDPQTFPEPMFRLVSSGAELLGETAALPVVKAVETSSGLQLATLSDQTDPNSFIVLSFLPEYLVPPASAAAGAATGLVPETAEAPRHTGDGQASGDRDTPRSRPPDESGSPPGAPAQDAAPISALGGSTLGWHPGS